ncbi:MAG: TIGR03067 domain-containing protein [Verrucomicrobia bacterium]|nr:TIGR03067 domain-containing protein [Verrucomicrobiota bacterium]
MRSLALITFAFIQFICTPFSVAAEKSLTPLPAKQADTSKTDAKNDAEQIQGTWKFVSAEDSGRKTPDEAIKILKWVITKDKITQKFGDKTTVFSYTLDLTKKPRCIDLTEGIQKTNLGIYELEGDNLKICIPEGRGGRSTAFESKPDSVNDILFILKREKPPVAQ